MNTAPTLRLAAASALAAFVTTFSSSSAVAANRTWNGGGSPNFNWSVAANWGGTAPVANDTLFFDGLAGTLNTNDIAADTSFGGLIFNNTAGAFSLYGNGITLGGNMTNSSANAQRVFLGLKYGASRVIDGGAAGFILGKGLTNTANTGVITVTLAGTGTITNLLGSTAATGTNIFTTATSTANWTLVDNPSATAVTLPAGSFTVSSGAFNFGTASSSPNLTFTAGTGTDNTISGGSFNMANGTLTTAIRMNTTGTGIINVTGGTMNIGNQIQNANGASSDVCSVNVSGGTVNSGGTGAGGSFFVASRGQGTLTVSGGGLIQCGTLDMSRNITNTSSKGVVNLNGGAISVNSVTTASSAAANALGSGVTCTFNFNGGTLRAKAATVVYQGNTALPLPVTSIVKSGGAFLDSGVNKFFIREPLQHDSTGPAIDGGLTKLGTGLLVLTNVNTYTGPTLITAGTLTLTNTGTIASSSPIDVTNGAIFDVSLVNGGYNVNSGQFLGGNGVVTGAVNVANGGGVSPGYNGPGVLLVTNSLVLNGNTTNGFQLSNSTNGNNSKLVVGGNLTLNNVNAINITEINGFLQSGRYTLITYSGTLTGTPAANLIITGIATVGTRQTVSLVNDIPGEIDLIVGGSPPATLSWAGNGANNNWDLTTTADWLTNGVAAQFYNDDTTTFGDSGSKTPAVNLVGSLAPAATIVSNTTGTYVFSSDPVNGGSFTGGGSLTKANGGTLALFEISGDSFTGGIFDNGGTLVLSNNNVNISGGISVNNGATLIDAHSGTIAGGLAVHNGTAQVVGSPSIAGGITLTTGSLILSNGPNVTGDVTVNGGTAILGGNGTINGNIISGGGNTTVTNNPASINNITVNGGSVLMEQDSGAAAPSGNTSIGASGTLQLGNNDNRGAINISSGTLTDNGSLVIDRTDNLTFINTLAGTGTFTQAGTNIVTVAGLNSGFTGHVSVQQGTLQLGSALPFGTTSAGINVAAGATLDLNNFALTNAIVTVNGSGVTNGGAIVNNNATGGGYGIKNLTLNGNVTFGGQSRWDIRNMGSAGSAIITNNNNAYNITKVGPNSIGMTSVSVDPALANIDIQQGMLSLEQGTTSAGNPANTLTVESGATLQFYQLAAPLSKPLVLNGSGTTNTLSGANGTSGQNILAGPITLNGSVWVYVGSNSSTANANLTFSNNTLSGSGTFTKVGPGTNYMNGVANYSGITTVSNGVLSLNGTSPTNNIYAYGDGSTVAGILSGTDIVSGPVTIGDYGTLNPGNGIGTITITNGLTLTANSTNLFEINRDATPNSDLVHGLSVLNANGNLTITNLGVSPQYGDVFRLYDAGSYAGAFGTINLPALTFPLLWNTNVLVNGTLSVGIDPSGNLKWTGATSGNWDTSTQNWLVGANPATYTDPDGVLFDDTATTTTVSITGPFNPVSLVVSNNTKSYTFTGGGGLGGNVVFQQTGTGTVLLDNSGFNGFTGGAVITGTLQAGNNDGLGNLPTAGPIIDNGLLILAQTTQETLTNTISGNGSFSQIGSGTVQLYAVNSYTNATFISNGVVEINNSSSLGQIPGGAVTITNGGTLDLGGSATANSINFTNAVGLKRFFVAGAGVGGNGAIINSVATNQQNAFQSVTLTADATFGGPGRFDLRGGPTNIVTGNPTPVLDLAGHKLTKTGTNQISMVSVSVTSGNIDITQATLSFENTSAVNGSGTVSVETGGLLGDYHLAAGSFTRAVTLNGGAITNLNGGGSTNDAPITLAADSFIGSTGGNDFYLTGPINGSFGFTKNGSGNVFLSGAATFGGNVTINSNNMVQFGTNTTTGNLPATASVTDNGTIAWSRSDNVTVLNNINSTLANTGNIAQNGSGLLLLDNPGSLAGSTTISAGTLQIGNNDALGSLPAGNITDNGTLIFDRTDAPLVNGVVSGAGSIIQSGSGTVKLFGANSYSGGTLITNGFLLISNSTALGTAGPGNSIVVTNGGTLDFGGNATANNLALRAYTIQVSGGGVTNGGAIVNSGAFTQQNAVSNVTMVGSTIFGGNSRWDIRGSTNATTFLNTGGNPYKLTKVGTNFIGLVNATVDPSLGDVDVTSGLLDFEATTTGLGNTASNLFIRQGATLEMWQAANPLNKVITIFGDGVTSNIFFASGAGGQTNTITGRIVLSGANNAVITANASGNISNVISGAQGLIINATGQQVSFASNNTYTGSTVLNGGTLALVGNASISNSSTIIVATNGNIDVLSHTPPVTLEIAPGQTLYSAGTNTGNLLLDAGATMSPGAGASQIGQLNVTVNVTLKGLTIMEINKSNPGMTNDTINSVGIINAGGTLFVTNLGPALVAGDTFQFANGGFNPGTSFTNLILANPGSGLGWNTNNLYSSGTLSVVTVAPSNPTTNATITSVKLVSGGNLWIHGTNNNVPNTNFHYAVITSTNIATRLTNWTAVVTNPFNPDGTFDYTNPIVPGTPRQFIDVLAVP